eukprot:TRINITY_DN8764_c0_g2_i1.p1 TRINITY_DN8764_c0_g2~~TRINITY_DN8764_c0_g2_i1.p1  ORF type:complete len:240 (-),score=34.94 TRINITY_DN8764_c0_g2_i1:164-805(-)
MAEPTKTFLLWPWTSSNLKYHVIVDTLVNQAPPDGPRNLYPEQCNAEKCTADNPLPEPAVLLQASVPGTPSTNLNLVFVSGTGLDPSDPMKSNYDRAKATLDISGSSCDAVVVFVSNDDKNPHQYIQGFHGCLFGKGMTATPTYLVCLDDSEAKGKDLQQKAAMALANYGSAWIFKTISSSPTVQEVNDLFSGKDLLKWESVLFTHVKGSYRT